ncbi:hypothetical protein GGD71_004726 [Variovorax guangxiensis]|uniref:Uncharacterized protein n=1 Tax=Variovorax guangxiensis TaxID=1775474 RepID=A0A840FUU6_9BURK|nr:hypothetical protein [Variovorax guangxiensis]
MLGAGEDYVDAGCAKAAAHRRIVATGAGQVSDGPLERFGLLTNQQHAVDAETRRLGFENALDRSRRRSLGALVDGAFVLLAQGAFALLLALLLNEGLGCAWDLGYC